MYFVNKNYLSCRNTCKMEIPYTEIQILQRHTRTSESKRRINIIIHGPINAIKTVG